MKIKATVFNRIPADVYVKNGKMALFLDEGEKMFMMGIYGKDERTMTMRIKEDPVDIKEYDCEQIVRALVRLLDYCEKNELDLDAVDTLELDFTSKECPEYELIETTFRRGILGS